MERINLADTPGTIVMPANGDMYIMGATEKQNEAFRARCRLFSLDEQQMKNLNDRIELKGITKIEYSSETYNDFLKIKGMPGSIFGNAYGYDMQKQIGSCMRDFYAGKISGEEVKDYFGECCSAMRIYCSQERFTNGRSAEDNTQIISQVYEIFAKENARAARKQNHTEGKAICEGLGQQGRTDDWVYYNSDYYYACENTKNILREAVSDIAEKWELGEIDCDAVEKNSKFTLDGGFDFHSGWNWEYRNQVSRGNLEKEDDVPPENFRLFFKESFQSDEGILKVWAGETEKTRTVPFYLSPGGSVKGQIFNVADLLELRQADKENSMAYNDFLKNMSVFTRRYAQMNGTINKRIGYKLSVSIM